MWGQLGGGALINIGHGLLGRKEAGGETRAGITRPVNVWVKHEGGRKSHNNYVDGFLRAGTRRGALSKS